ncbi:MAG: SIR2 family protein, partial [Armatimonadetes bacterium]|nr:SIR2 family protein [Armatimonadota bacterium]
LRLWPWRKAILDLGEAAYKRLPADYKPTEQSPLVYYLYGHFAVPNSMVLTEDDYLSYVVGTERYRDLLSKSKIADMLGSHGLLFLGFQVEDWDFRVAMRQVGRHMNKGDEQDDGGGASRAHVAVQLEPQDDRMLEPDRAREFVRHSLNDRWKTSIYLGTALEFLRELRDRLKGGLDGV